MFAPSMSAEVACDRCGGSGWWTYRNGHAKQCPDCSEDRREAEIAKLEQSIGSRFRSASRDQWRGPWPLDREAEDWAATPGCDPWCVVLLGNPGVGKTLAATILFREILRRPDGPHSALWIAAEDATAIARAEIEGGKVDGGIEARMRRAHLLLLDDVGRERATPHSVELIRRALHGRYLHQRPTILTSNAQDVQDFKAFDPALASRLHEGTLAYRLTGTDKRVKP